MSRPIKVEVGHEGVLLHGAFRRRFIRYNEIVSVEEQRHLAPDRTRLVSNVVITLREGRLVTLGAGEHPLAPAREGSNDVADPNAARDGLFGGEIVRAVRARMASFEAHRREASPLEERLARQGRTAQAWRAHVARLNARAADTYREAGVGREGLWRLLENPAAEPSARAGAALVLRTALEADEVARARVVVEHCASPRLRVALEHAFADEGDEGAVEAKRARAFAKL